MMNQIRLTVVLLTGIGDGGCILASQGDASLTFQGQRELMNSSIELYVRSL